MCACCWDPRRIESSARAAREAASLTLLKELEEEEEQRLKAQLAAAKAAKAAREAKEAAAAGAAATKKAGANKKAGAKAQDPKTRAQKERERELVGGAHAQYQEAPFFHFEHGLALACGGVLMDVDVM